MKKIFIIGLIMLLSGISLFTVSSCNDSKTKTKVENLNENNVIFLFEKDGIKVYRFTDNMNYHYFTSKGEIIQ